MRRRRFIALAAAALIAPGRIAAAQTGAVPTIGFLGVASRAAWQRWTAAFVDRLGELGWRDGTTVRIDYRWSEGSSEKTAEYAAALVRLPVDVIVTAGAAGPAVKRATPSIPIVLAAANDPVGAGLVESLSRPGGNVTGLSVQATDTGRKRFELLREIVPGLRRATALVNADNRALLREVSEVQDAARFFGCEVATAAIRSGDDIDAAIAALAGRTDALYVTTDPLLNTNRARIGAAAVAARLPTIWGIREAVAAGALASYGASFPHMFRRAADYVDKVLRGARPGDLPVEQPTTFDLAVNLRTAKALGIEVPASVLARADEVIE